MTDLRVSSIDDSGITFHAGADAPIDVLVDGRRVWSFWSLRDSETREKAGTSSGPRSCAASSTAPRGSP